MEHESAPTGTGTDRGADYIVVGTGPGGSPVVRRLVDAGHRVTVLEAGPTDARPEIDDPRATFALFGTEVDWGLLTEPQEHLGGRVLYLPRGRTLGGTSAINGMVYVRGAAADFDAWEAAGAAGWAWKDVEPYFRRLEDFGPEPGSGRGSGGPLPVRRNPAPDPVAAAFVAAAAGAGHPRNDDYNDGEALGASLTQATLVDGGRVTAWRAYVAPVLGSPLLTVVTGAHVTRVLIEDGRAVGVEYRADDGEVHTVRARREVVLAAGVFGTPQILLLSGVGPADHLHEHGITRVVDLPGVGENLRDHAVVPVVWERAGAAPGPQGIGVQAQLVRDGSENSMIRPDRQGMVIPYVYSTVQEGLPASGFTTVAVVLHPYSTGTVRLRSADPADPPRIDPAALSDPRDVEALMEEVAVLRELGRRPELADHVAAEVHPGKADLREYVHAAADAGHHQVGTARMGTDALAVVDPRLRVRGVAGLRVADASVMPFTPAGNTAGPTFMIGERAADLLLEDLATD
ncbi:GMC family oxidoreductase [Nocardiopsis sp. CC223A]|uniref:GMC family oxidoreductase n=1 Tax=Nocardiopsis sp. CC223A TaxID=3044051 RepID=UPI00278C758A|nr:GMC family oxidoreductase N-terminal domain-containing protein [Nocardiopsis sp. CC223A]